jgi:hypothetical protein
VDDFRVLAFEYVGDLSPFTARKATCLARINFPDRDLNPGPFICRAQDLPDVPFGNRDPGLVLNADDFDHASRSLLKTESDDFTTRESGQ